MKVINFFAGPGSGKSTTAAGLFYHMKSQGINCELVTEYAKDLVWEERDNVLSDQLYILAKQNRRLARLKYKVDYVITDSPLLLQQAYCDDQVLRALNTKLFKEYDNLNIYLERGARKYNPKGRQQTYEEAKMKDQEIKNILKDVGVQYWSVQTNQFDFKRFIKDII